MKLKTGFSKLNEVTDGGLDTGGVWLLAGGSGSFKTGLGLTLAKDIAFLNKVDESDVESSILVLRTTDSYSTSIKSIFRILTGYRNPALDSVHEDPSTQLLKDNNWRILVPSGDLLGSSTEVEKVIQACEKTTSPISKIRIVVFDYLTDTVTNVTGDKILQKSFFDKLVKICEEHDILAIVPTNLPKEGVEYFMPENELKNKHRGVSGVIIVDRDIEWLKLNLRVWSKSTKTCTDFSIPFKEDPQYGLVSDITP